MLLSVENLLPDMVLEGGYVVTGIDLDPRGSDAYFVWVADGEAKLFPAGARVEVVDFIGREYEFNEVMNARGLALRCKPRK
jgi:hypothetical protein